MGMQFVFTSGNRGVFRLDDCGEGRKLLFKAGRIILSMPVTLETVTEDALGLSNSGRAILVEKLLASLAGEVNPDLERAHLNEVQRRRDSVKAGKSKLIEGAEALRTARSALRK